MEPTRCHFTVIFENVVKFFWQILPGLIFPLIAAGSLDSRGLILLIAVPAVFILALLLQFFSWRMTWLSAADGQLVIKSGIFWKKVKAIPFEKINTIDLSRNLFQRLFGTCRLKVDTGAVTGGSKKGAEVNLVFTLKQAESIRSYILSLATGSIASLHDDFVHDGLAGQPIVAAADGSKYTRPEYVPVEQPAIQKTEPRVEVRANTMDFFLYGLTQNKIVAVLGGIFAIFAFAQELISDEVYNWIGQTFQIAWNQVSRWDILLTVLISLAIIFVLYIVVSMISILYSIVRFYNFSASREGDNIHIEYGLLTAKSYTLPIKNVHAVIVSQNIFRQLLKQCSVEIVSIGYGDEKNEVALLFPLIRLSRLEELIGRILPEYQGQLELQSAPRTALRRYLLVPLLLLLLASAIAGYFWTPVLFALIVILPLLIFSRWLNYRNAGIAYSADRLEVRSGGFSRRRYRVQMSAVQSVRTSSHPLMERADLRNYRIDYHAPAMRSVILVKFMADKHLNELRQLLDI